MLNDMYLHNLLICIIHYHNDITIVLVYYEVFFFTIQIIQKSHIGNNRLSEQLDGLTYT